MSELPRGWATARLDELCTWGSGGTPRRSEPSFFGGTHPWITISDLNDGVVLDTAERLTEAGVANSAAKLIPANAVLVALYGSIGKLGITSGPATTNQAIAHAAPNPNAFETGYLFHFLRSVRAGLAAVGSGVTQKNIYLGDLKAFTIPVAPRAEQTRIVSKLEELLSDLDAGVAELKAAQKKLQQYRQSLLKAAVEGSLTAAWREERNPAPEETGADLLARILRERRARWEAQQLAKFEAQGKAPPKGWQSKYPEPLEIDPKGQPSLPPGWAWASLDQLAHVGTGVTPLRSKPAYFEGGDIPWVTSGALNAEEVCQASENVTRLALQECRLEIFPPGSLLVAMYGEGKTRGKCAELSITATINQAIAAIVLAPSAQPCKAYVKAFLLNSYEAMRQQASGGVQPNLNLQIVKALAVPLPPLAEQAEIVTLLAAQTESLATLTEGVQALQRQSTAQRQNLLRAAFAGQLVPQDPADEPAAERLARIRAERAAQADRPKGRKARVATQEST